MRIHWKSFPSITGEKLFATLSIEIGARIFPTSILHSPVFTLLTYDDTITVFVIGNGNDSCYGNVVEKTITIFWWRDAVGECEVPPFIYLGLKVFSFDVAFRARGKINCGFPSTTLVNDEISSEEKSERQAKLSFFVVKGNDVSYLTRKM